MAEPAGGGTLVFTWGNPSRGDDALGPLFADRLSALRLPGVECLTDFQLQVEHALDLDGRCRILFVDAALDVPPPYRVSRITPGRDPSFSSHAMSPVALLEAYRQFRRRPPPPAWQLAIRGERWDLGEPPSVAALAHLEEALAWTRWWCGVGAPVTSPPTDAG
jgi:hydrogenase maturation protease